MSLRNHVLLGLALFVCAGSNLSAAERDAAGHGYLFAAPGTIAGESMATLHFGGGGEARIYKGFGAALELGYLAPLHYLSDGIGVFSANGSYHFLSQVGSGKVVPFASAGYSLGFRSGTVSGFNVGAGIN